MKNVLGLEID